MIHTTRTCDYCNRLLHGGPFGNYKFSTDTMKRTNSIYDSSIVMTADGEVCDKCFRRMLRLIIEENDLLKQS